MSDDGWDKCYDRWKQAERKRDALARRVEELEGLLAKWLMLANGVPGVTMEGRATETRAALASGEGGQVSAPCECAPFGCPCCRERAALARRVAELEGLLREIEGSNWNCPLQDCYGEDHQHDAHCRLRAALAPRDEARGANVTLHATGDLNAPLRAVPPEPARCTCHAKCKHDYGVCHLKMRPHAPDCPARGEARLEQKRPPPPESLVGALHDRIHPTSGPLLKATPVARDENRRCTCPPPPDKRVSVTCPVHFLEHKPRDEARRCECDKAWPGPGARPSTTHLLDCPENPLNAQRERCSCPCHTDDPVTCEECCEGPPMTRSPRRATRSSNQCDGVTTTKSV